MPTLDFTRVRTLALLAERGIDDEVLAEIRGLLAQLTMPASPREPAISHEEWARPESDLWNWFKEQD